MAKSTRKRVLLVCGGRSTEHRISLISCCSLLNAIDRTKFAPIVAGIDLDGIWHYYGDKEFVINSGDPEHVALSPKAPVCFPMPTGKGAALVFEDGKRKPVKFDIALPMLHGSFGEDGTIQGLFEMLDVPYVGCDVAASANCMDKERTKVLASSLLGLKVAPFYAFEEDDNVPVEEIVKDLGLPLFVKPASSGSSVGITRVEKAEDLDEALDEAFRFDRKVLVEQAVLGAREIECAVLEEDGGLVVADPGEIIPKDDFYDFNGKYLSDSAKLQVPAKLPKKSREMIREAAAMVFNALECGGMARVDFFYRPPKKDGTGEEIILNEVNTIPGFTSISLYPKMMENSGIGYAELVTKLLENGFVRHSAQKR